MEAIVLSIFVLMGNKVVLLLILIFCSFVCGSAKGITLKARSQSADAVFADIMRQSGKNFVYPSHLLNNVKVTVDFKDAKLEDALDILLKGTAITYRIRGNNVVLSKKKSDKPKIEYCVVSGFVRESGSGEPLVGALARDLRSKTYAVTNSQGFYSLRVPAGNADVLFSYPGFSNKSVPLGVIVGAKALNVAMDSDGEMLDEFIVHGDRNNSIAMHSVEVGALNLTNDVISSTPVIFGESDVIKTFQLEPGVSPGMEGFAGMYVHGGGADQNLYMIDNIPLYQVNHFAGLFSAFNTEALRNVDFYKSTFPAKYDGRLSSFIDVHTKDGSLESHHGSVKLGLTSGAFNIDGPLWKGRTSYSFALRRSWYDLLMISAMAIYNSFSDDEKSENGFAFTDINAKVAHSFNERSKAYAMFYYGEDYMRVKQSWGKDKTDGKYNQEYYNLRWGNLVASLGWNYVLSPNMFAEFTLAYSRYKSLLRGTEEEGYMADGVKNGVTLSSQRSDNHINDWIIKSDLEWKPSVRHAIKFGASFTRHGFLPFRDERSYSFGDETLAVATPSERISANEFNIYANGDYAWSDNFRIGYGIHYSLFNIEGKTHGALSPRFSFRFSPFRNWSFKGGYSRTVQYVYQLSSSSISLPTDQWVPVMGGQSPQTADNVSLGFYFSPGPSLTVSLEGYIKRMNHLLDYSDNYYLFPPDCGWIDRMVSGKGKAKGLDFKIAKDFGRFNAQISYSLLWTDRLFPDKNSGKCFPERFDNRHKINLLATWKINRKWEMSVTWTGMSGNRITLPTQCWTDPGLLPGNFDMVYPTDLNNFRLPFYHRMDLGINRNTKNGFWNFSLYNAYCNVNTIAVRRDYAAKDLSGRPVFQKVKLLPIIPSISYTWIF